MLPNLTSLVLSKNVEPTGWKNAAGEVMSNSDLVRQILEYVEKGEEEEACAKAKLICSLNKDTRRGSCGDPETWKELCKLVFTDRALDFAADKKGGIRLEVDWEANFHKLCDRHLMRRKGMEKLIKTMEKKPDTLRAIHINSVTIEMVKATTRGLASKLLYDYLSIDDLNLNKQMVTTGYDGPSSPTRPPPTSPTSPTPPEDWGDPPLTTFGEFRLNKTNFIDAVYQRLLLFKVPVGDETMMISEHYANLNDPKSTLTECERKTLLYDMVTVVCEHAILEEGKVYNEDETALFNNAGLVVNASGNLYILS